MEVPKRLAPTRETIRQLFAFTGNRCAYPGCLHPLIDSHGNFVAEVCHIEAAEPRGPRFNAAMTNEERRLPANLLLLCHRHHVETDDAERFSVAELKRIKADHEAQFEEAVTRITESAVVDLTKQVAVSWPASLGRMRDVLEWQTPEDELRATLDEMLLPMLERFGGLAPDTRGIFLIALERSTERGNDLCCPLAEIEQVTGTERASLHEHLATLERYEIGRLDDRDEAMPTVVLLAVGGWPFWRDLVVFCERTDAPLRGFVLDLRFDLLD